MERLHAMHLAHSSPAGIDLFQVDQGRGPAFAAGIFLKPPSSEMVRAGDYSGTDCFRNPDFVQEISNRRLDLYKVACSDLEPLSVLGMHPHRVFMRNLVQPFRVP